VASHRCTVWPSNSPSTLTLRLHPWCLQVVAGDSLVVLEAMKMEHPVKVRDQLGCSISWEDTAVG
jgi:hypothetical protein